MEQQLPQAINIYPSQHGIVFEVQDGDDKKSMLFSPDDCARLVMSLLTTSILFQINEQMRRAVEQQEFEQLRQAVETSKLPDLSKLKK